jgi:NAD-dependent deacetylase
MSDIQTLANMISEARNVLIFTGAGISTESGIPDFRSPGGVWTKMQPIMFQDFVASREKRKEAWDRVYNKTAGWTGAAPNSGHHAVKTLVDMGKVKMIVTQNVDNLHQDSGVPDEMVVEIHGNASYAKCLECGQTYSFEGLKPRYEAGEDLTCEVCEGLLKSATISFGQAMPEEEVMLAQAGAEAADLCIAIGSSLVVYPAAQIPLIAKQTGAKYVILNREETEHDPVADLVINAEIGETLEAVLEMLT